MKRIVLFLIIKLLVISILLFVCFYMFGFKIIKSNNMSPSFKPGTLVIYYKLNKEYKRDDVISIDNKIYRVMGVYKDKIKIENNQLFINEIKEEDKIYFDKNLSYYLNKDEYFILNDNRRNTNDSRVFGKININIIDGLIIAKIQIRDF